MQLRLLQKICEENYTQKADVKTTFLSQILYGSINSALKILVCKFNH